MSIKKDARNPQLQMALREFIAVQEGKKNREEEYIMNRDIGIALGYGDGATISQYINDNTPFKPNLARFEAALASYLDFGKKAKSFEEKRAVSIVDKSIYVPTSISQDIYNMIDYCILTKGLCILHGEAGIGKTTGAKKYVKDNKGAAYFIRIQEGRTRKREIIAAIAKAFNIKDAKNDAERYNKIRKVLHRSQKVFIFDEAHRFPLQTLEFIRDLAETIEDENGNELEGAGVVLIGNSKVAKFIQNLKRDDMEQFRSRSFDREYLRKQTTLDDVRLVFPYLANNDMERELKALYNISALQSRGLRGAVELYNHAANSGGDVSLEALREISRMFNVGIIDN